MTPEQIVALLLSLLQAFFGSNPTVQEIEIIVPQIIAAIAAAKAGQSISISFPIAIDGKKGAASFSWSPSS